MEKYVVIITKLDENDNSKDSHIVNNKLCDNKKNAMNVMRKCICNDIMKEYNRRKQEYISIAKKTIERYCEDIYFHSLTLDFYMFDNKKSINMITIDINNGIPFSYRDIKYTDNKCYFRSSGAEYYYKIEKVKTDKKEK